MSDTSQATSKKGITWNRAIINNDLANTFIGGQGQNVTFICKDDKNAEPQVVSDKLEFEKIFSVLKSGVSVDQSIQNRGSNGLVILAQGQEARLDVDINALKMIENAQTHQAQQETNDQFELQEGSTRMNLL